MERSRNSGHLILTKNDPSWNILETILKSKQTIAHLKWNGILFYHFYLIFLERNDKKSVCILCKWCLSDKHT